MSGNTTVRVKNILKAIGCNKLRLYKAEGHGYWYFVYDDAERSVFETQSVYVARLNHMDISQWIAYGEDLVKQVDKQQAGIRMKRAKA